MPTKLEEGSPAEEAAESTAEEAKEQQAGEGDAGDQDYLKEMVASMTPEECKTMQGMIAEKLKADKSSQGGEMDMDELNKD